MNHLTYKDQTFSVGDSISVSQLVKEGDKERVQVFEGILIAVRGRNENQSFTVRKIAAGAVGVERIWPVHSPKVITVKLKRTGKANRAKLYYLRGRVGKTATRLAERQAKPHAAKPAVAKKTPVKSPKATKSAKSSKSKKK